MSFTVVELNAGEVLNSGGRPTPAATIELDDEGGHPRRRAVGRLDRIS